MAKEAKETKNENKELSFNDAVDVLLQAAQIAQQKGAFSLQNASMVYQAMNKIQDSYKQAQEAKQEDEGNEKEAEEPTEQEEITTKSKKK